ncbi:MAG: hypothetical protein RSA27_05930, partial [Oscillospiraceae bacterium]
LPVGIKNHISEKEWWTERPYDGILDSTGTARWSDYTTTAKIGLLGHSEFVKYFGRFGLNLDSYEDWRFAGDTWKGWSGWWLRTSRGLDAGAGNMIYSTQHGIDGDGFAGSLDHIMANNANIAVRPTFYLNENFFKDVKLDINKMGDFVKQVITKRFTLEEMRTGLAGYNERELTAIGYRTVQYGSEFDIVETHGSTSDTFYPKNKAYIDYVITNKEDKSRNITIKYNTVGDNIISKSDNLSCLKGENKFRLDMASFPNGNYNINIQFIEDGTVFYDKTYEVNISPVNNETNTYRFANIGLNTANTEKDIKALYESGVRHIRMAFMWEFVEKQKGVFDFSEYDKLVTLADSLNIEITGLLAYSNPIYFNNPETSDKQALVTPEQQQAYANYCAEIVRRYPKMKAVEIWNEPNNEGFWIGTYEDYYKLVKVASTSIRNANNTMPIYAGSIDISKPDPGQYGVPFMQEMFDFGLYEYIDGVSFHPYFHPYTTDVPDINGDRRYLEKRMIPYTTALEKNGGFKTLPITEVGFDVNNNDSYITRQAREVVKSIVYSQQYYQDNIIIYCFRDDGRATNCFGMLDKDYNTAPMYFTVSQYMAALGDAIYIAQLETQQNTVAHLFLKDNKPVVIAWALSDAQVINFNSSVDVENHYGNSLQMGTNSVKLSLDPVYITGISDVEVNGYIKEALVKKYNEFSTETGVNIESITALKNTINSSLSTNPSEVKEYINQHFVAGLDLIDSLNNKSMQEKMSILFKYQYVGELLCRYYSSVATETTATAMLRANNFINKEHINKYAEAIGRYALRYANAANKYRNANGNQVANIGNSAGNELLTHMLLGWANYLEGTKIDFVVEKSDNQIIVQSFCNTKNLGFNMYVAIYDAAGKIVNVTRKEVNLNSVTETGQISINPSGEYQKLKIFAWDHNMRPIVNSITQ